MQKIDTTFIDFLGTPVFVLEPDDAGRVVYAAVNNAWCEAAKRRAEDAVGRTAQDIFSGRHGTIAFEHHMSAAASRQKSVYDLLLPLGDRIHTVRTTLTPVLGDRGELVQLVGASIDITSELDDFIYLAAHDLRSPMRHVASLAEMLSEDFADPGDGRSEIVAMIRSVSEKAFDLITDILSHAQAVAAAQPDETFDLLPVCTDILAILDPYRRHRLAVRDQSLTSDKVAVQVVLRNLFDNAIKHSGREIVDFSVEVARHGESMVEIALTDNGKGFEEPAIAFLDGGKFRVDSGFGLHGIRRLVQARGGTISAANRANGAGSIIRFTLPGTIGPTADRPGG